MAKVHAIMGGVRGAIERRWYRVKLVCGPWRDFNPPTRKPEGIRTTWKGVTCKRCLRYK